MLPALHPRFAASPRGCSLPRCTGSRKARFGDSCPALASIRGARGGAVTGRQSGHCGFRKKQVKEYVTTYKGFGDIQIKPGKTSDGSRRRELKKGKGVSGGGRCLPPPPRRDWRAGKRLAGVCRYDVGSSLGSARPKSDATHAGPGSQRRCDWEKWRSSEARRRDVQLAEDLGWRSQRWAADEMEKTSFGGVLELQKAAGTGSSSEKQRSTKQPAPQRAD